MTDFPLSIGYIAVLALSAPVAALTAVRLKVLPVLRKTYFFRAVFSLLNFGFFRLAADAYKNHLIEHALKGRTPACLYVHSFTRSLGNAGADLQFYAHAMFVENGRNFYWSYSELAFFEGKESLNRNFSCP